MLIRIENFMGKTKEYDLAKYNIFTGPNGSGKTTLKNAMEYTFTGSIAELNTPGPIFLKYASGRLMNVSIEFNGVTVIRGIEQTATNDGYKYTTLASVVEGKRPIVAGVKKVDEYLQGQFLPLVFSYDGFLREKSTKRREIIASMIGYDEPFMEAIEAQLVKHEISTSFAEKLSQKNTFDDMINYAIDERAFYNKEQKKYKGATASINEMKSSIAGNLKTISKLSDELNAAIEEKQSLTQKIFEAKLVMKNMKEDADAIQALREEIEQVEKTSYADQIKEKEKEIRQLKSEIKEVPVFEKCADLEMIDQLIESLAERKKTLEDKLLKELEEKAQLMTRLHGIEQRQHDIKGFDGVCPVFGIKCTTDTTSATANYDSAATAVKEKIALLEDGAIRDEISICEKEIKDKILEQIAIADSSAREIERSNNRLIMDIHSKGNEVLILKEKESSKQSKIEQLHKAITTLTKEYPGFDPIEESETLLAVAENRIEEMKFQKQTLDEKQNLLNASISAAESAKENEDLYKAWDKVVDVLNKYKIELMSERLVPIKESVDKLLSEIGYRAELFFDLVDENGKDQLNFGWIRNGNKVTNLSQGEHLLTSIGVLAALQNFANIPFKMLILDEILILDECNAYRLVNSEAIAKLFDFVLLLSPYKLESEIYTVTDL